MYGLLMSLKYQNLVDLSIKYQKWLQKYHSTEKQVKFNTDIYEDL